MDHALTQLHYAFIAFAVSSAVWGLGYLDMRYEVFCAAAMLYSSSIRWNASQSGNGIDMSRAIVKRDALSLITFHCTKIISGMDESKSRFICFRLKVISRDEGEERE